MNKMNLNLIETFSGCGMQRRGIENTGLFNVNSVATCELDINAIISYAAIHCGLTPELVETYEEYPSREEMAQWLIEHRIGYDFTKDKEFDWNKKIKSKSKDIERVWLACKLSHNYGDIAMVQEFPKAGMLTFSFPCFVEGTMVLTKDGYKEIQDVSVGDEVLTHTNKWQKVSKTMVNNADKLISINCLPSENIHCTPNHPFYVKKKGESPRWVEAKDLTKEYLVGTAINPIEELPKWNGFNKTTTWGHKVQTNTLSEQFNMPEFWYVIGRYIGDGWLRNQDGIIICANREEVGQIYPYLDKLGWGYTPSEERTVIKIHIPFQEIGIYCEQFGKGAANKHLTSDILNLPIDLLKSFLEGYMDADGSFTQKRYKATSVSRRLIYELAQCINKAYHRHCSVYFVQRKHSTVIEGRTVNQRDQYQLAFTLNNGANDRGFYEDGYIWSPIKSVTEEDYDGLVYNMEVENDNSYQVQNVIVHNCTDISIAGKQKGFAEGETRSGLVWEVVRILKNMKNTVGCPNFLLMENVDALVNKKNLPLYLELNRVFKEELGYNCVYDVLNAKWCGVPQNRNRVFAIYALDKIDISSYEFPKKFDNGLRLKDVLEDDADESLYINNPKAQDLIDELILNGTLTEEDYEED